MQKQILDMIVNLGGKILSEDEFFFPHHEFHIFCYEDCPEARDWVAYPKDCPDVDMSLLIIDEDAFNNLEHILRTYFEIDNDSKCTV